LESSYKHHITHFSVLLMLLTLFLGLFAGWTLSYFAFSHRIADLENQVSYLQKQIPHSAPSENVTYYLGGNISLSEIYEKVKDSVVVIYGTVAQRTFFGTQYVQVQGSGFVYNFSGQMVVITNFHVINGAINIVVTFANGNAYAAEVLGSDPYADLAVLSVNAPESEFKPLEIASSSTLRVGDIVIAVGNPFGLTGSMTVGIVSQLRRAITESTTSGFPIANVIQTSAPINPGNSGGPLLNCLGQVVGITTAIVANSQGLGFAVPSNTILREIASLVTTGSYNQHPWLGVAGTDMTYDIAKKMHVNVTYGWLIVQVVSGGPADKAGLRGGTQQVQVGGRTIVIGGDIIIAINGTRIINGDDMSSFLEEFTLPGQTVNLTIVRDNQIITVPVELGTRPPPS